MTSRSLAANAFWSFSSHVLHRGSLMLGAVILARSLSAEEFAAYGYYQMTIAMLATYTALGMGVTASRFFAEVGHSPDEQLPPIGALLSMSMVVAALAFLFVLLIPEFLLATSLPVPQWMIALGVGITIAGIVPAGAILGLEKYRSACAVSLLSGTAMLVLISFAAAYGSRKLAMWSLLVALGVQVFGQLVIVVTLVGRNRLSSTAKWSKAAARSVLSFAGPTALVSILAASGIWIAGRIILARSAEIEFVLFTIGMQWFALGLLLPGVVGRVIMPRVVRVKDVAPSSLVRYGVVLSLVPAISLFAATAILGEHIIGWYGEQYISAVYLVPAFALAALIAAPINTIGNAILARNGQMAWLIITLIWFSVLVTSLFVMQTPTAVKAALGMMFSYSVMLTLAFVYGRRSRLI